MEHIAANIERFIRSGEGSFEGLALELFAYQFEKNTLYQTYCRSLGVTPGHVGRWQEIPAVPVGAFKSAALATFPVGQAAAIFESSASTTGTPSRHYLKTLSYYETSLKINFARRVLDEDNRGARYHFLILTPPPSEAPRSSLTWMMDVVKRTWGRPGSGYFIQRGRLDEPRLSSALEKAEASGEPVILMGTTISFLAFFDYSGKTNKTYQLPSGTRLLDTGGMKTSKREITRPAFVRQVGEVLGIPENHCINEYGMCELSSQFYGRGSSSYLEGPHWANTLIIDPVSGRPSHPGNAGLLRHVDLANVDSVMAIQTEDVGMAEGQGFLLQGRDPAADLKGCSLSAEQFTSHAH